MKKRSAAQPLYVPYVNVMCDLIAWNEEVWDIWIYSNIINGIGLNPFTIRVKIDYTQMGFDPNYHTGITEAQGRLWIRSESIRIPQCTSSTVSYEKKNKLYSLMSNIVF